MSVLTNFLTYMTKVNFKMERKQHNEKTNFVLDYFGPGIIAEHKCSREAITLYLMYRPYTKLDDFSSITNYRVCHKFPPNFGALIYMIQSKYITFVVFALNHIKDASLSCVWAFSTSQSQSTLSLAGFTETPGFQYYAAVARPLCAS